MNRDPDFRRKISSAMKAQFKNPERRLALDAGRARWAASEAGQRQLKETGRKLGTQFHEAMQRPDVRRRAVAHMTATKRRGIPAEYVGDYRFLRDVKKIPAPEARRMIAEMIETDRARYERTGELQRSPTPRLDSTSARSGEGEI